MRRFVLAGLALAALICAAPVAKADISIDTFDHPNPPVGSTVFGGFPGLPLNNQTHASILGERDLSASVNVNSGLLLAGGVQLGGGIYQHTADSSTAFSSTLNYDNFGSLNLSGETGIQIDYLSYDNGINAGIADVLFELLTANNGTLSLTKQFADDANGGTFLIPFSEFGGDVSQVLGLSITFNNNFIQGHDFILTSIGTFGTVPEPMTMLVWGGMGMAGLALARRRARAARAVA